MKRSYRRQRTPQQKPEKQQGFFAGSGNSLQPKLESGGFFPSKTTVQKKDTDREEESAIQPMLQKLSTPEEDEAMGTAEERMERDRSIQEQHDDQMPEETQEEPG